MVMGEVSLCRVEELPPTFTCELRPALAKGDPAVLSVWVPHESFATASWSVAPGWPRTGKLSLARWQTVSITLPTPQKPLRAPAAAPRAPASEHLLTRR
jgi:hypothetical protein